MLADGTYDGFCVDVEEVGDDGGEGGAVRLSITIVAGARKGEVVEVRATGLGGDPLDLIGMPCTIRVEAGQPSVTFD